jgi:hypothetical protein
MIFVSSLNFCQRDSSIKKKVYFCKVKNRLYTDEKGRQHQIFNS